MIRSLFGRIFPFLGAGNETETMQNTSDWEHVQEADSEIPQHEFLDASDKDVSSGDIQSHSFLDVSENLDVMTDADVSMEIKAHPLLTEGGEQVVVTPKYSPRSGSSVDPEDKYPPNLNDRSAQQNTPLKPDGSGDKAPAAVQGETNSGKEKLTKNILGGGEGIREEKTNTLVVEVTEVVDSKEASLQEAGNVVETAQELEDENTDKGKAGSAELAASEEDQTYLGYVQHMTANKKLIKAKDLFYQLGFQKGISKEQIENAAIQQYKVAASKQHKGWIKDARFYAELLLPNSWIDENLPSLDRRERNRGKKKRQPKYNRNEQFELPGAMCKDYRLQENPDLPTLRENAAYSGDSTQSAKDDKSEESLDKFVSDYTSNVIDKAIKIAISDGLSESTIMEVIEDVTSGNLADTPRKGKFTAVDQSRTPRQRPDQLAMGFNYHSDVVVKESPKTLHGEIIPIDLSKQPREKPDQIAMGFNYHSDVIVKESPRAPNGEILTESSPATPRRRARDQLAMGFSYHSKLLAKDVAVDHNENLTETVDRNENSTKEETVSNVTPEKTNGVEPTMPKSAKKSVSDIFAVGFSYNSDLMVKESMDQVNGNIGTEETDIVEEKVIENGEINGNDIVEISDMIGEMKVAGSVW